MNFCSYRKNSDCVMHLPMFYNFNTLLTIFFFVLGGDQGLEERQWNDIKKNTFCRVLDSLLHPVKSFPPWSVHRSQKGSKDRIKQ